MQPGAVGHPGIFILHLTYYVLRHTKYFSGMLNNMAVWVLECTPCHSSALPEVLQSADHHLPAHLPLVTPNYYHSVYIAIHQRTLFPILCEFQPLPAYLLLSFEFVCSFPTLLLRPALGFTLQFKPELSHTFFHGIFCLHEGFNR